jgi:hypothetical protein
LDETKAPEPVDDRHLHENRLREKHFQSTPRGFFELQTALEKRRMYDELSAHIGYAKQLSIEPLDYLDARAQNRYVSTYTTTPRTSNFINFILAGCARALYSKASGRRNGARLGVDGAQRATFWQLRKFNVTPYGRMKRNWLQIRQRLRRSRRQQIRPHLTSRHALTVQCFGKRIQSPSRSNGGESCGRTSGTMSELLSKPLPGRYGAANRCTHGLGLEWETKLGPEFETESMPEPNESAKIILPGWEEAFARGKITQEKYRVLEKKWRAEKRELGSKRSQGHRKEAAAAAAAYRLDPDASRPYFQFLFYVSRERKRVWHDHPCLHPIHEANEINRIAYEGVKRRWVKNNLWDGKWGKYPGVTWKHEFTSDAQPGSLGGAKVRLNSMTSTSNGKPKGVLKAGGKKNTGDKKKTSGKKKTVAFKQPSSRTTNAAGRPSRSTSGSPKAIPASGTRRSARIAGMERKEGESKKEKRFYITRWFGAVLEIVGQFGCFEAKLG